MLTEIQHIPQVTAKLALKANSVALHDINTHTYTIINQLLRKPLLVCGINGSQ